MKGYKTVIFNSAVAALPVVDMIATHGETVAKAIGSPPALVAALSVVGLVNIVLRWVTNTPVFRPE